MCGDDDDHSSIEDALYARFLSAARALIERQQRRPANSDPVIFAIDKLFLDALSRAVKDTQAADAGRQYALLAMQPLAFARLAGFLAGHLALGEDPLRKLLEAMMHGYGEAETTGRSGQIHEHDHGEGWHDH